MINRTKDWGVALAGLTALGGACVGEAKTVVLDAPVGMTAAETAGAFGRLSTQPVNHIDAVQSVYRLRSLERPYGMLSPAAATTVNYTKQDEPAASWRATGSFRELSDADAPQTADERNAGDPYQSHASRSIGATATTDAWLALSTLVALTAYQLRRKQQLLKRFPFSA